MTHPALTLLLSPFTLIAGDELVVSSFQPAGLQRYDAPAGTFELVYGASPLTGTLGATVGPDGLVYVASEGTDEVLRFHAATGAFVDAFVTNIADPSAVVFGPDGMLYVASFVGDSVLRFDGRTGAFDKVFVQPADGNLNGPDAGMVFGPDGDLYIPSYFNHRIKRYDGMSGAFVENFIGPVVSGLANPRTVLFMVDGFVLVTSEGTDEVLRFDANGDFVDALVWDDPNTGPDETGGLDGPTGFAFGPDDLLYVASIGTDEVKRYEYPSGTYVDDAVPSGLGGLSLPTYLFFRTRSGQTCPGSPNSVGSGAALVARGSTSVSANRFELSLAFAPPGESVVFVQGKAGPVMPAGDGFLCLGAPLFRLGALGIGAAGSASLELDLANPPNVNAAILAGSTWQFQAGYRDPNGPAGTGFNFSAGVRATFAP